MAELFEMRTPLSIRLPDGTMKVMAEHFPHPSGLLYFDLYWHESDPATSMHIVEGRIHGDGPWKIGDHVINVLGCHGTNAELATAWAQWSDMIADENSGYPPPPLVAAIARKMGAVPGED